MFEPTFLVIQGSYRHMIWLLETNGDIAKQSFYLLL